MTIRPVLDVRTSQVKLFNRCGEDPVRRHRLIATAGAAVFAACLATASPAIAAPTTTTPTAAAADCTDHEFTVSGRVVEGSSAIPWNYFIVAQAGTISACLDGPDGADFDLVLRHFATGGLKTVATSSGEEDLKTLSYEVADPGAYRIEVAATKGSGEYTVGLTIP
ncbi:hypothetical protein [Streptomyces sp. MW-W600-10]|uniref:hypothetical protein n=1 Tax=Streptomyces sp. MW-W600-10 TaxID=2829819 RepID=UPI001C47B8DB|nr:hypothetical protein [Streptomyces sp. MW-W600-10]MBV7248469.1 hypothetical protein [Streptomyces sp. MW-W600-10]